MQIIIAVVSIKLAPSGFGFVKRALITIRKTILNYTNVLLEALLNLKSKKNQGPKKKWSYF